MGNGRHSGLIKGSKNNIKNGTSNLSDKISKLKVTAKQHGYDLKESTIKTEGQATAMTNWFKELHDYQKAMNEDDKIIAGAGGSVEIHAFSDPNIGGDSSGDGTIRMAERYVEDEITRDTLPHEHTHNLVDYLITKELGYAQGSHEFNDARIHADIYQSINNNALQDWKTDQLASLKSQLATIDAKGSNLSGLDSFMKQKLTDSYKKIDAISTPYEAAKFSGMRDYATRDYPWAPKGAGIEIPTVASEMFVKTHYNWTRFSKKGGYAYYVLRELKNRLH